MNKLWLKGFFSLLLLPFVACNNESGPKKEDIRITADTLSVIYSKEGRYVAFCDATKFEGKYYCVFREGENHAAYHDWHKDGFLKIMSSKDLINWSEELEIKDENWDLRDPCFCVVGKCIYLYYGYYSFATPYPPHKTGVSVLELDKGKLCVKKTEKIDIGSYSYYWLWKVYYDGSQFYGATYDVESPLLYVTSKDGIHFNKKSEIVVKGDETSLEIIHDKRIVAVIRNITAQSNALLAISQPPYDSWISYELNEMIESPESFIYNDEIYVLGRSKYGMSMFKIDIERKEAIPVYNFFAYGGYGDCGYPGVILEDNNLTVIYYAVNPSTEKTTIYQTKLSFTP